MRISTSLISLSILFILIGCGSTKTAQETTSVDPVGNQSLPQNKPKSNANPCGTFNDSENPDAAIEAHVLYRDLIKAGDYDGAFPYWQKAFSMAPAADGKRRTHYLDGMKIKQHWLTKTEDSTERNVLITDIMKLYDGMEHCYGGDGYLWGLKAFDLYYEYPGHRTDNEVFDLFKKSMDTDGDTCQVFIINPMTDLLVKQYFRHDIDLESAQKYAKKILRRIDIATKMDKNMDQWNLVKGYAPQRLEVFEGVKNFYDCEYFRSKYFESIQDSLPTDCDELRGIYGKLNRGGCSEDDPAFEILRDAMRANCKDLTRTSELGDAYSLLQQGNYEEAISKFEAASQSVQDVDKKANIEMLIAKVYYAHLKQFHSSREWALKAAKTKNNWGEPFLLIGRLYASSGPLCGPGRGWDSQIVTWPAIDQWQHAKRIDPSVSQEANKWISKYSAYMPTVEDGFQRGISEGSSFYVGCWIKESTTVRLLKN